MLAYLYFFAIIVSFIPFFAGVGGVIVGASIAFAEAMVALVPLFACQDIDQNRQLSRGTISETDCRIKRNIFLHFRVIRPLVGS